MSRITAVKAFLVTYRLPEHGCLEWTGGTIVDRSCVFIRIEVDDGRIGWGEIGEAYFAPRVYVDLINDKVSGVMVAQDANLREELERRLKVVLLPLGCSGMVRAIISGIDMALWNIDREMLRGPIEIPVYASTGFARDLDKMCAECDRAGAMGFNAVKIRGGFSVDEDITRVDVARSCLGKSIGLILELGQPYSHFPYTEKEVTTICAGVAEHNLLWVEEPFWPESIDCYRMLARSGLVRVACGENLYTESEFSLFGQVVDVCQPDITRVGGPDALVLICKHCRQAAPHQFGTSVALHALCATVNAINNFYMLELDLLKNPIRDMVFGYDFEITNGRLVFEDVDVSRRLTQERFGGDWKFGAVA